MVISDIVVVSACRTPIGKFGGSLRDIEAYDLGAISVREAVRRAGIEPGVIEDVCLGNTRQAGNGPNPARTAAVKAGLPENVPAETVNMACPSSMKAFIHCADRIRAGDISAAVAGGFESMSRIPYLLKDARWEGFRSGDRILMDGWSDTRDPLSGKSVLETAEKLNGLYDISRIEQDTFSLESHRRAARASDGGLFKEEMVPVIVNGAAVLERDENIRRDIAIEDLLSLDIVPGTGTITAGNSCPLADGSCAAVVMSRQRARSLNITPLFSLVSFYQTAVCPDVMGEGPSAAVPGALKKASMNIADIDLFEINEVFALQVLVNARALNVPMDKLNVNGGSMALGNPTGMTSLRLMITLYNSLKNCDREFGAASLCGAAGVTMAAIIRRES